MSHNQQDCLPVSADRFKAIARKNTLDMFYDLDENQAAAMLIAMSNEILKLYDQGDTDDKLAFFDAWNELLSNRIDEWAEDQAEQSAREAADARRDKEERMAVYGR